jgi:hypothetical protein
MQDKMAREINRVRTLRVILSPSFADSIFMILSRAILYACHYELVSAHQRQKDTLFGSIMSNRRRAVARVAAHGIRFG